MSSESQRSIADWAQETFGLHPNSIEGHIASFKRACEEMAEFMVVENTLNTQQMIEEAADVVITLYVLADRLQYDLHDQIDRKMVINRARRWIAHGDGTGHHVK